MNDWLDTLDLQTLAESCELECKAAQGRDGRGALPHSVWETYSAMANSDGGVILLGVEEDARQRTFRIPGLKDVEGVRKALWDNLHNRSQVSANLLVEHDVQSVVMEGRSVLRIHVPRATRQQKPVHVGSNPFGGTYVRRHEGDYHADDEAVRRMLAERVEDSRDERVLKGFGLDDLDLDTVAAYRNRFSAVKPGHVWSELPVPQFLEQIGAVGRNRDEGYSGLRLAGLLMFGRAHFIRDALPHYMVDYQERPQARTEKRWVDRLVPDGSWSGNVYDFFRKVYQKLTTELKVPFQLKDGQRIDDTPVHEALREALVNTLIHADYSGRVSVLVVKRPDMFGFRNPGRMRIAPEVALRGGNSDCRNRRLQTMFQLVGYGDHAGSGLPKIWANWAGQHWRWPQLHELPEPEQTLMELHTSSLVPEPAIHALTARWGARFTGLSESARLALITAQVEGLISHDRLKQMTDEHPADLTKLLAHLVRDGFLVSDGAGRGTVYFLPGQAPTDEGLFDMGGCRAAGEPPELGALPPELGALPPELALWQDHADIPESERALLARIAEPVALAQRVRPDILRGVVLQLCAGRYLGLRALAELLHRDADDLRKRTLKPMVDGGELTLAFPSPRDPRQAYTATTDTLEERR